MDRKPTPPVTSNLLVDNAFTTLRPATAALTQNYKDTVIAVHAHNLGAIDDHKC